jgi:hypothetical protein
VANRDRVGWLSYTVRRGLESVVEVRSGASAWPSAIDDAGSQAASFGRRLEAALQQRRHQQAAEHCTVWAGRRSLKTWVGMQARPRVVGRWSTRARCGAAARYRRELRPGSRGVIAGLAKDNGRLYALHGYLTCYRRRAGASLASGGPHKIKRRSSVRGGLDERVWACAAECRHCTCGRGWWHIVRPQSRAREATGPSAHEQPVSDAPVTPLADPRRHAV